MWLNDKRPDRFDVALPQVKEEVSPTFGDAFKAAFERETTIGSFSTMVDGLPDYKETDYAPVLDLTETEKLDPVLASKAKYADSIEELNAVRTQLANERFNQKQIQDAGAMGIGAVVASQFVDPINLIPIGGTLYKTYRNGESILKAGITTAFASAGVVSAQEALLHQTQIARTYGESATNITAAGFLGGVLGVGSGVARNTFSDMQLKEFEAVMNPEARMAEGKNPNLSDEVNAELKSQNLSAMAVDDLGDAEIQGGAVKKIVELMRLDPQGRIMTSGSKAAKETMLRMSDFTLAVDKQVGMSVEKLIKNYDGFYYKAVSKYDQAFSDYIKRESGGRFSSQMKGKLLGRRQFAESVGKTMREGSDDPIIQKAADAWRSEVYEPLLRKAVEQKLLPEDLLAKPKDEQLQYVNRVYNTEAIQQNRGEFERMVKQYLDEQNVLKTNSQNKIRELSKGFDDLDDTAKTQRTAEIETELASMPSKIANEVRSALKQRGKSATTKTKAIQKAIEKVLAQQYDEVSTETLAQEIATRIVGTNNFRPMYDFQVRDTVNMPMEKAKLASPFQTRAFLIPDNYTSASGTRFDQFLENDIELLGQIQIKRMAPDIEMTRVFGSVDLTEELTNIAREFDGRIKDAADKGDKKLATKLERRKDRTLKDVEGIRDRLRNRYAQPDPNHFAVRMGRVFRDWNYIRLMGGVVPSSIPDAARTVASVGLARAFGSGLRPVIKGFNKQSFSAQAKDEMGRFGIALEALWNRNSMLHDVSDITRGTTKFERGTSYVASKFSNINFMNQWNQTLKMAHALSFQTKLIDELMAGKIPKELGRLGISKDNAEAIRDQLKLKAQKDEGVWLSNADLWENQDLRQMWVGALRQENDRIIVTPGQEKPLFMSTEFGKTLLQFRSFMTSSTYRIFLAGLQGQDAHYMQGIVGMVTLGAMSYAFKEWNAGREVSDDPTVWLVEGIDRSGMLGILMEVNNTSEKLTGNRLGIRGLTGVAEPASRYASRSALDSMVGPSFGLLGDTIKVFSGATGEYDWTDADTRALQRLMPGQNLFYLRQQLDKIIQTED